LIDTIGFYLSQKNNGHLMKAAIFVWIKNHLDISVIHKPIFASEVINIALLIGSIKKIG